MDPDPKLIRPGAAAAAPGDPSITLIETDPALGGQDAEGRHQDTFSGARIDPRPTLIRPGAAAGGAVATTLSEPSITLIEAGPALGVLTAEGCHQDSFSGRLFLDRVTWVRGDESVRALRDFPCVCLGRDGQGPWVAEEVGTGRLFPRPSRVPYRVIFITPADYQELMAHRAAGAAGAIFAYTRSRFGGLPGFRVHERGLVGPEGYAAEAGDLPAHRQYVSEGESG
jgi:hypothetical protein